jgi:alanyl-tRNA synthetase
MKCGSLKTGNNIITKINEEKRKLITQNHSATHLLHTTLKNILGNHVKQAGSLINENNLRFDYIHFKNLSNDEKNKIEKTINNQIHQNLNVKINFDKTSIEKNKFNQIKNRMVVIGENISEELCAGTHVKKYIRNKLI